MAEQCGFCLTTESKTNFADLKNLQFEDGPNIYDFPLILNDVVPGLLFFNKEQICEQCYTTITTFFLLKRDIRLNNELVRKVKQEASPEKEVLIVTKNYDAIPIDEMHKDQVKQNTELEAQSSSIVQFQEERSTKYSLRKIKRVRADTESDIEDIPEKSRKMSPRNCTSKHPEKIKLGEKTSIVMDLLKSDQTTINLQVDASKTSSSNYSCIKCYKHYNSRRAMGYHYVSKHMLLSKPRNLQTEWIGRNIRENEQTLIFKGHKKTTWKCTVCSKDCVSKPTLRYHLEQHLKAGEVNMDV